MGLYVIEIENIGGIELEKVISLESSQEHYDAEACIFWCFDDRFWRLKKRFIELLGFKHFDCVSWGGSSKDLIASEENLADQKSIISQARKSIVLHHAPLAIPVHHIDCGAYGGSETLGSREAQYRYQAAELAKSEALLKGQFPGLSAWKYIADFDGLRRVCQ